MYKKVDLYYEPIEEPNKLMAPIKKGMPLGEMSKNELAFICGLLKESRPKKLLEIGVAAGGTTAVIVNCLSMINCHSEVFSVDIAEQYYRYPEARTGYLFDQIRSYYKDSGVYQELILGKSIPYCIEKIGGEIDFLIIDTMHVLPGEVLDFLCVLPFLSETAVVVVHDVSYNLLSWSLKGKPAYATRVLLSTVKAGEKYFNFDDVHLSIGGFKKDQTTWDGIEDVFSALSITWSYMPLLDDLKGYLEIFVKYYNNKQVIDWLKTVCYLQEKKIGGWNSVQEELDYVLQTLAGYDVYIYGTGLKGRKIEKLLSKANIKGHCISRDYLLDEWDIKDGVVCVDDIQNENTIIVLAADSPECYWHIIENGLEHIVISDEVWKAYSCI